MSGAWWSPDDDNATAYVADRIGLVAPQGPVIVSPDPEHESRLIQALSCCSVSYKGASVVKGGSPADRTFGSVMGVGLSVAWITRSLNEGNELNIDELVIGMAQAQSHAGHLIQHCLERATKLVLDASGEYLCLLRAARHSLMDWVRYSAIADARGVDAVLKLWRRPESSVQIKRSMYLPPSTPGRWNVNIGCSSGESEWIEPASVAIATPASVDAYVRMLNASMDSAVA